MEFRVPRRRLYSLFETNQFIQKKFLVEWTASNINKSTISLCSNNTRPVQKLSIFTICLHLIDSFPNIGFFNKFHYKVDLLKQYGWMGLDSIMECCVEFR